MKELRIDWSYFIDYEKKLIKENVLFSALWSFIMEKAGYRAKVTTQ